MTRYRLRAVLLLFLLLNLTACTSWRSVTTQSPGQLIEALQPDRVRVTMQGGIQMELERPAVDGDELVGTARIRTGGRVVPSNSVSLADVLMLEIREFSLGRTVLVVLGAPVLYLVIYMTVCPDAIIGGGCSGY